MRKYTDIGPPPLGDNEKVRLEDGTILNKEQYEKYYYNVIHAGYWVCPNCEAWNKPTRNRYYITNELLEDGVCYWCQSLWKKVSKQCQTCEYFYKCDFREGKLEDTKCRPCIGLNGRVKGVYQFR